MAMRNPNPFSPDFGRPPRFYGRRRYVRVVTDAMERGIRPNRSVLIEGVRGSGKTALLCHLRDLAEERGWDSVYVTSVDAANSLSHDIALLDEGRHPITGAGLSIAGFGGSLSVGERGQGVWRPTVRQVLVDHMRHSKRGLLILIDEMQKISEDDAQAICDAVITARTHKDDVSLVMAGLPGSLRHVKGFPKCTYMARSTFMFLTTLSVPETTEALRSSFARVPEMRVPEDLLEDLIQFTKGHPYLIQLVGYNLYRSVERAIEGGRVPSPVDVTPNMVFDAEESAYASYSAKVLDMVLGRLGSGTRNYLRAIAATMDERGVMRSDASIAEALGKRPESVSSYRTRLKALGIIDDPGRGTLVFRIPYVMRYLDEGPIVKEDEPDDGDEQHFVMN